MKYFHIGAVSIAAVFLASASPAYAKKKPEMSALAIQQIQTRDFEANKSVVFSSIMTVLQDSGYRIGSADKETGLITGVASTNSKTTWVPFMGFGKSKKTPVVSAFIEDLGPNFTKVRLNFVMTKATSNGFGSNQDEEPILEQSVYQEAFEKVDQAIFIRLAALESAKPKPIEVSGAEVSSANTTEVVPIPPTGATVSEPK